MTRVEPIPIGQQGLAMPQLRFPLLPPVAAQTPWDEQPDERDESEVRFHAGVTHATALQAVHGSAASVPGAGNA